MLGVAESGRLLSEGLRRRPRYSGFCFCAVATCVLDGSHGVGVALNATTPIIQLTVVSVEPSQYGDTFRFVVRLADRVNGSRCQHVEEQQTAVYLSSAELHSYP